MAKTSDVSPAGFLSSFHEEVDATPAQAWSTLTRIDRWWSPDHTYSGDAANLALDAQAGGCWCERWKGGSVEHMRVLLVLPERTLRLSGGLGPLQGLAVNAVLTVTLARRGERTSLDFAYRVRGAPDAHLDGMAEGVDGVLGAQVKRLAALLGPAPAAPR